MVTARSPAMAIAMAAEIIAFSFAATSCGLLSDDVFPSWLAYADSYADIDALAEAQGLGSIRGIDSLEYAAFAATDGSDYSKVLAFVSGMDEAAVIALEPAGLGLAKTWKISDYSSPNNLNRVLKTTAKGFLIGGLEFDPANLEAAPFAIPAGTPPDGGRVFCQGNRNYLVAASSGNAVAISVFDASYAAQSSVTRPVDDDAIYGYSILDAEFTGGKYRMLINIGGSGGYVVSFSTEAKLLGTLSLRDDPAAELTGPFPVYDDRGWLTDDGFIVYDKSDGNVLKRYAYGDVTAAVDELRLDNDTEGYVILSFDEGGTWWFMYDKFDGRLYELRTWW